MVYSENLENAVADILKEFPRMKILENEEMRNHTSMKVGGPVRALAIPSDVFSLSKICYILKQNFISPLIIGNGTNMIFPDEGLNIFVISTEKLQKIWLEDENVIYAEAGVSMAKLAQFAQQNGLAGLEFASGIPGTVGGGVLMNAGAYGGEMKDVVKSVVCYYLPEQTLYELPNEDCAFSYRYSMFDNIPNIVLSATFSLTPGNPEEIAAKMKELNEKRRVSQPLDLPSSGSAFKRPKEGYAAALIEEAGLKGYSVGGAQVSDKHSGFVVNKGGATYDEIVELMQHVRQTVYNKSNVQLDPEIKIYPKNMVLVDDVSDKEKAATLKNVVEKMKMMKEKADKENNEEA